MPPSLAEVCAALEHLAPTRYAGSWDNVGLLVQSCDSDAPIRRVLLTIDLSPAVVEEVLSGGFELVVAYHPPIFRGLKRLTRDQPDAAAVLALARAGVSAWSPHTALDAAPGGVCDWLIEGLGALSERRPIEEVRGLPPELAGRVGAGRVGTLAEAATLEVLVGRVKTHLGLAQVRVAAAPRHAEGAPLRRVAVCPGAGGTLFEALEGPELFLTGELRHHDVLSRVARGASVILTDHTHCERGYLPTLALRLGALLPELALAISQRDQDPLVIT